MNSFCQRIQRRGTTDAHSLTEAIGPGPWLCVAPHDDDVVLGMGLIAAAAIAENIELHLIVASDGAMGYCDPAERASIAAARKAELSNSCAVLGLPPAHLHYLALPDTQLIGYRGELGRRLTKVMRQVRPTVVCGPNPLDVHPDHQAVAADLDIACFWSATAIWHELGRPIALPTRWDYAVYAPFAGPPDVRVTGTSAGWEVKERAFAAFASQQYVLEQLRCAPPVEHLRRCTWDAYHPAHYDQYFL